MTDYITVEKFIDEVEKLGLTYRKGAFDLYIKDDDLPVASINLYQPLRVDTRYDTFNHKNPTHLSLYQLIHRLALTPLDKREIGDSKHWRRWSNLKKERKFE